MLDLEKIRKDIDRVDTELAKLFEERMDIVLKVVEYKRKNNLPIKDEKREELILNKSEERVKNPKYAKGLRKLMRSLIDITCEEEEELLGEDKEIIVGYQGVEGAYSHVATGEYFSEKKRVEKNFFSFEDVLKAITKGEIEYGVLPIENSSTGGIREVYDLIREYNCSIVGEKIIKIDHNLMAYPGTKFEDITEVYSHAQGFSQSADFFKHFPNIRQIPYYNTAMGAKHVAESKTNYMASVSGKKAGERYGLEIIRENINGNKNNHTRFIVVAKNLSVNSDANKITMVVTTKHQAGSLSEILNSFAKNEINVLNLESRPIVGKSWEYFFHIDINGNLNDEKVKESLKAVENLTNEYKILGNYKADRK